jgi:hypothetical protein
MSIGRKCWGAALTAATGLLAFAGPASAGEPIQRAAGYPDMTTYSCRTDAIEIQPGQNLNRFRVGRTCPNAEVVNGQGDTSVFTPGSNAEGYLTRFEPSMVEILDSGKLVTPSVWDLHLHHAVWIGPGGPVFGTGEEKTSQKLPQGYGLKVGGDADWSLNEMIHNLTAEGGRRVYLTWEIDWVPETDPPRTDINPVEIQWMDVAGFPQLYPVFDAERGFDRNGDGDFVFPDEVPSNPNAPGYEERAKISRAANWVVPPGGATLVYGVGHLHPGGEQVDLRVARDGPDEGTVDGDDPAEVRPLFRSAARYYEPAGAVSWDVSMEAPRRDWRIRVQGGDTLSIDTTYDVEKASWYESMGILPLMVSFESDDPAARDPFEDAAEVREMYERGGILTHGRLPENVDRKANKDLGLPDPRDLKSNGQVGNGIEIDGFRYSLGGYSAFRDIPSTLMRPPLVKRNRGVSFTNLDALPAMPDAQQRWHSITSCKAPCNRGSGIGYPLADGPLNFDSGQLGYGTGTSSGVTTGSNEYTTPPLPKAGKTYTYFCRIHPFMRGSVRVRGKESN